MVIVIVILHILVCLFLIAVILLQAGRGQGLSWGVFGGTPQSILGTKTASFLSRVTTGCAIIFLFTCIVLNVIETRKARSLLATPNRRISQVDFAKIKEALEKAEQSKKAGQSTNKEPVKTTVAAQALPEQTSSTATTATSAPQPTAPTPPLAPSSSSSQQAKT